MAEMTKRLLHLRPNFHSYARPHPCPLHHFSSSSNPDTRSDSPQRDPNSTAQTGPSFSSNFNDIRASLHQQRPPQNRHQIPRTPPRSRDDSNQEIRRQLSEFRIRTAAPPPPPSSAGQFVSLRELYERNVNSNGEGSANPPGGGKGSFDMIRSSLRQHNPGAQNDSGGKLSDRWSISRFTENLKLKGDANANKGSTMFAGGNESLFPSFLRKEGRGKGDSHLGSMAFGRMYDHLDLGKKLKKLRPENRKGKWFSLQELSERLAKLREAEKKESEANPGISLVNELRDGIVKAGQATEAEAKKLPMQSLHSLGSIGGTESYELFPPKNHLVEKYFHPDNMSSAEKLKLELKKVRDEFKMSESDCGSAPVQVAQLTLKIKHLSAALQKKDKHSRKGLQAMVQRRKKLLKYLRRTDWDSYCLVLSKLGLRDNPDIKA